MSKWLSGLLAGIVFGLGLTISGMVNPAKVLAFLDLFGNWDPSLGVVMGAALVVTMLGYRLVWRRPSPIFAERFQVPGNRKIDRRLATGAVLFGIGWGLAGLCPGPAIAVVSYGGSKAIVFIVAMAAGMLAFDLSPLSGRKKTPGA